MDGHVAPDVLLLGTDPLPPAQDERLGEGITESSAFVHGLNYDSSDLTTVPLDWRWAPHVGREIPSFFILEINVVRFIPSRAAVPAAPPITHLVSCKARRI